MVSSTGYPNCCGAYVLQVFGNDDDEEALSTFKAAIGRLNNRTKWTFVLNESQIEDLPETLSFAASIGFVLNSSWVNYNHDSRLYEFERCGERIDLVSANERLQDLCGWTGKIKNPLMGGTDFQDPNGLLPAPQASTPYIAGDYVRTTRQLPAVSLDIIPIGSIGQVVNGNYVDFGGARYYVHRDRVERVDATVIFTPNGGFQRGDRVLIDSPRSRYHRQESTVIRVIDGWNRIVVELQNGASLAPGSLRLVNPRVAPQCNVLPFRDEGEQEETVIYERPQEGVPVAPVVVAPIRRTVTAEMFRAIYRDGREGAYYGSLETLRAVNPNARRYQKATYYTTAPYIEYSDIMEV